jgi:hypothetical protein
MPVQYVKHRRLKMKQHPDLTEKWVQAQIASDPGLLGLGEVDVKDVERVQPRGGRLDMLLYDPLANTRYEVELQLGATDESHIIRAIEYWDIERRRWPQYEHVAVIVAEEITARFFNVISLFNGFIPVIAIQVSAIEIGDAVTLVFTTVLDRMTLGTEEDEEQDEPADRGYWLARASAETLGITEELLKIIQTIDPGIGLKYNKHYIGLARAGVTGNYVSSRPRRKPPVLVDFKIPRSDETDQRLEAAGIETLTYQTRYGQYRLQIDQEDLDLRSDFLKDLARIARDAYHGPLSTALPAASARPGLSSRPA